MKSDNEIWIMNKHFLLQLILLPTVYLWYLINKNKPSRHNNIIFVIVYALMSGSVTTLSFNVEFGFGVSILIAYLIMNPFILSLVFGVLLFDAYLAPFLLAIWGIYEIGIDGYAFLRTGNWDPMVISEWYPLKTLLADHSDWVGLKNIIYNFTNKLPDWIVIFSAAAISVYLSRFIGSYWTGIGQRLKMPIGDDAYSKVA